MSEPTSIVTPTGEPTTAINLEDASGTNTSFAREQIQTICEPEVSSDPDAPVSITEALLMLAADQHFRRGSAR